MKMVDAWREFEKSGFFNGMRMKLLLKEHKHSNEEKIINLTLDSLVSHYIEEANELKVALQGRDVIKILEECVDVANMCAFLYAKLNPDDLCFVPDSTTEEKK